jgi:hypothetical protein
MNAMKHNALRLAAASLLVVTAGACSSAGPGGSPGAAPTGTPVAAPTASPAVGNTAPAGAQVLIKVPAVEPQACMDALLSGTLAVNNQTGLGVENGGEKMAVEWPFGYSARMELGVVALVDETGKTVAKVGDTISVGGGFGNQLWHACGPVTLQPGS